MSYNFTVSPDFKPDLISGWFVFNTWLQKQLDSNIHLELHNSFKELSNAIDKQTVDLVYSNPHDISRLVRDEGFLPVAKPKSKPDEAIIATSAESNVNSIEDLSSAISIAQTDAPDVNTIGMIMLEPADLAKDELQFIDCATYVVIAKHLISGDAEVGFFLAEAFNELSGLVQKQLKPLISSKIHMIHHALLVGPKMHDMIEPIQKLLLNMHQEEKGRKILSDLDIADWEIMDYEEAEFMIDLMDTLVT